MAIENAKTLNVRIKNKYDSYENWAASGLILEAGEIAIAYTTVNVDIGNGKIEKHPELLMKVGNNVDTFANLPWLSAKAADVAAWAKAATKPTYAANEITGIADYIADYVSTEMGIEVDTDTQYQIVKVDDYNYKLQSKGKGETAWADVADSAIVIPNDTAAIEALEGLVGEKSVAVQISEAIAALDLANTYDAKGAADEALTDAKEYADGLNTAMDTRMQAVEGKAHEHANKAELDKIVEGDKAKWDAMEQNAKTYADGLNTAMDTRVDALEAKFGDGEGTVEAQIAAAVAAEKERAEGIEGGLETRLAAVEGDYLKTADKTSLQDQITDNAEAIAALDTLVGDTAVATQISTAVAAEAEIARAAEKANADAIDAIEADYLKTADKTELQGNIDTLAGRVTTNENNIATLNGNSSVEGSVDKKIADAINEFATQMSDDDTVNTYKELINYAATHGSEFTELVGEVDANTKAIATLNGDAATAGSVDKKIADAIAAENLAQYATDDELSALAGRVTTVEGDLNTETTGLKARMTAAEADIDALEGLVGETAVAAQIEAAITALKIGDYAKAADLTAAVARIAQNETDIDALEGRMDTAEGDIDALETEVAKKANDADLAAIAKTGSTDDLVQGEMTLVFDCGTSAV